MRKLSEGAEAKIFETKMFGKEVVIKFRNEKKYRIKELDTALRKTRTKNEARLMSRASENGVRVPRVLALGKFSIYLEMVRGKLLKDTTIGKKKYAEIGMMLAKMHNADITHGDFTPANIIVNGNRLYVIDFGLSESSSSVEEKALDLLLMKRSIPKSCYEEFERSYLKWGNTAKATVVRLAEIEKRGRYQIRTLM